MSMPIIERPENPIDRGQSVNDLIESVALVETGLAHIINAEGEKIQKVLRVEEGTEVPIEDILEVNDSVEKMVNSVSRLEMVLQNKLDIVKELDEMSTTFENAYMFASTTGDVIAPFANLPENQILHNFTPNGFNDQFTTSVAGTYLILYRFSEAERSPSAAIAINNVPILASRLLINAGEVHSVSSIIYNLNAGDSIGLNTYFGANPGTPYNGVKAILCAVKID